MRSFADAGSIFVDMDRLNPNTQTYQPETLPEREEELDQLHSTLRPATMGSTPLNAFVFGPTGQGKTVGVKLKTSQLQEFANEKGIDLHVVHVRCKGMDKSYHALTHLVKALREKQNGPGEELPSGHQRKKLLEMVIDELEEIGGTVIVILDEIDAIEDNYILYELPRAEPEDVRLSIIGITNDLQFRENLDADVRSSLGVGRDRVSTLRRKPTSRHPRPACSGGTPRHAHHRPGRALRHARERRPDGRRDPARERVRRSGLRRRPGGD